MNIKRILFAFATAVITVLTAGAATAGDITPVPFTNVHITDRFWAQRLSVMRRTTIRYALKKVEDAGQIRNFEYAGRIVSGKAKVGDLKFQSENPYDDAEVYKVLEGAAYLLTVEKDNFYGRLPNLKAYLDSKTAPITTYTENDIDGLDLNKIGVPGSGTIVPKIYPPELPEPGQIISTGSAKSDAKKLVEILAEKGSI